MSKLNPNGISPLSRGKTLKEEGCEVVCLPRTPEVSSSQMKEDLGRAGGAGYGGRDYDGVDLSR